MDAANGLVIVDQCIKMETPRLGINDITTYIMPGAHPDCAILPMGQIIREFCFGIDWKPRRKPILYHRNRRYMELNVENKVPFIEPSMLMNLAKDVVDQISEAKRDWSSSKLLR